MQDKDIHMNFRDVVPVSLLLAAFGKTFPLFLDAPDVQPVDGGANLERKRIFHALKAFSTSFPHARVDDKGQ